MYSAKLNSSGVNGMDFSYIVSEQGKMMLLNPMGETEFRLDSLFNLLKMNLPDIEGDNDMTQSFEIDGCEMMIQSVEINMSKEETKRFFVFDNPPMVTAHMSKEEIERLISFADPQTVTATDEDHQTFRKLREEHTGLKARIDNVTRAWYAGIAAIADEIKEHNLSDTDPNPMGETEWNATCAKYTVETIPDDILEKMSVEQYCMFGARTRRSRAPDYLTITREIVGG